MPKPTETTYYVIWEERVQHVTTLDSLQKAIREKETVEKNIKPDKCWIEKATTRHEKVTDGQIAKASVDRKTPRQRQAESTGQEN